MRNVIGMVNFPAPIKGSQRVKWLARLPSVFENKMKLKTSGWQLKVLSSRIYVQFKCFRFNLNENSHHPCGRSQRMSCKREMPRLLDDFLSSVRCCSRLFTRRQSIQACSSNVYTLEGVFKSLRSHRNRYRDGHIVVVQQKGHENRITALTQRDDVSL